MEVEGFARPEWEPLPYEGCRGVEGRVLLVRTDLVVALLRFAKDATIHEHAAPHDIDVFCLEGRGMTSVGGESAGIEAGQRVVWPAGVPHRLRTGGMTMLTLMIEHPRA